MIGGKEMNKLKELEKQVELYEKNIESQQQSLETLKRELERLKEEKENEAWEPKYGYLYWYADNKVVLNEWYGDKMSEARYELGNAFRTEEEAKFRIEQIKVEAELRRFSRPFHVGEDNYTLYFSNYLNSICMVCYSDVQYGNIYFASKEIAQKAIDTVGEDRIKKYYFGIVE